MSKPRSTPWPSKTLLYVSDTSPGFTRKGAGRGFYYLDCEGSRIREPEVLARIRGLAIPPAYREVWICPDPRGHLQATGRDHANRKQYRYHPAWARHRAEQKFAELVHFGRILPALRRRVRDRLGGRGPAPERVLAAAVRILDQTGMRVGSERYLEAHGSRGLTTLEEDHVDLSGDAIQLRFKGKHGMLQEAEMRHPTIARLIRRCQDLPGQRLLQYVDDDGDVHDLDSDAINGFLAEFGPPTFTSKTFRTWRGSALAWSTLADLGSPGGPSKHPAKAVVEAIRETAATLGNRPATCRKHYVHPAIPEAFEARGFLPRPPVGETPRELNRAERELLAFLETGPK